MRFRQTSVVKNQQTKSDTSIFLGFLRFDIVNYKISSQNLLHFFLKKLRDAVKILKTIFQEIGVQQCCIGCMYKSNISLLLLIIVFKLGNFLNINVQTLKQSPFLIPMRTIFSTF